MIIKSTIPFSVTDAADEDAGIIDAALVEVRRDGETMTLAVPGGSSWHCDQAELTDFLGSWLTRTTITFDMVDPDAVEGEAVNPTEVEVDTDGEHVALAFPGGVTWKCDQRTLTEFLGS